MLFSHRSASEIDVGRSDSISRRRDFSACAAVVFCLRFRRNNDEVLPAVASSFLVARRADVHSGLRLRTVVVAVKTRSLDPPSDPADAPSSEEPSSPAVLFGQ
ncbi:unnamed protein product [Linum trigynum]|uniref:Uncharacterized protein n=1 Tax=Linum trigynum TaxID=586398 RepID=A0AAV2D6B9_9ROSI